MVNDIDYFTLTYIFKSQYDYNDYADNNNHDDVMMMVLLMMMATVPFFQIAGQVWHQSFPVLLQILRSNAENNSWLVQNNIFKYDHSNIVKNI